MRLIINFTDEEVRSYANMYKIMADEKDIPDSYDANVERLLSKGDFTLEGDFLDGETKKMKFSLVLMMLVRYMEEKGDQQ